MDNCNIPALGPDGVAVVNWSSLNPKIHMTHYLWIIHNYSFYDVKGETLYSPTFKATSNTECNWCLSVEPTSENDEKKEFMGVYLELDKSSKCTEIFVKFSLHIVDREQKKARTVVSEIRKFDVENDCSWGFNLIKKRDLLSNNNLLPDDTLKIYCEVKFSEVEALVDFNQPDFNSLLSPCFKNDLSEDFEQLFENGDHTDVTISTNSKDFKVHKNILSARSPVFAAMFKHNTKENENNIVDISDIDEKVMQDMLYYMYTGKSKHMEQLAPSLLAIAQRYAIEGLKKKCECTLLKNLSIENAVETLLLADLHHASKLKSRTLRFIVANSTKIIGSEVWEKTVPSNPELTNEVCKMLSHQFALHSPK